jgi:hypothetical protein
VRLPQVVPSDANQAQGGHGHKSTMKLG